MKTKQDQAARIAEKIAKDLFTAGSINKRFTHLRASNYNPDTEEFDGLGCGWSEACAADRIADHIREARKQSTASAVRKERERCVAACYSEMETALVEKRFSNVSDIIDAINGGKRGKA